MLCFSNYPVAKEFMAKRGAGTAVVSRISIENFLTHMSKNFAREPFCAVFQKNSVAKKLLIKQVGEYKDCPSIIFFSHTAESFRRGNLLCSRKFLVSK